MQLYIVPGAPNARKSQAVANHLGLKMDIITKDFFEGDMQQDDYLALNPNAKTPVLVDGDFVLWETEAINTYLCQIASGQTLLPDNPRCQADVRRWQFWSLVHYNRWLGTIAWEHVVKPAFMNDNNIDEYLVKDAMPFFEKFAGILNQHLDGQEFMCGDNWTLADYSAGVMEPFALNEAMPIDWDKFPNVRDFYHRFGANPHWVSTAVEPDKMGRRAA